MDCFPLGKKTYVHLDDLLHARAGGGDNGLDVVAAGLGQVADAALNQVARGVGGDLTGDEDLAVGADGLGLGCVSLDSALVDCGVAGMAIIGIEAL